MTQITRLPVGLQKFLGTQAQGKNPSELSQVVVPTLDIDRFLAVQQEFWEVDGFTNFTASEKNTITVPASEVWLLREVGWEHKQNNTTLNDAYTASVSMSNNSNSNGPLNNHPLGEPYRYEILQGGGAVHSSSRLDNVIAPGGTQITFHATQVTAVGSTFTSVSYVRYLKLEI